MKVFYDLETANVQNGTILTIGVFDGLHIGHQAIIKKLTARELETGYTSTVLTFDPHPRLILSNYSAPFLLQHLHQRLKMMESLGVKQVVVLPFSKDLANLRAEDFLREIVSGKLKAREVYVGKNFTFGKERNGNFNTLQNIGEKLGFQSKEIEEVLFRNKRIQSTVIRALVQQGRVQFVRHLLGRYYELEETIVHGCQRGHQLSFPTANMQLINIIKPKDGVYITASYIEGSWYHSVTNIGTRPTVSASSNSVVETHIINFNKDLYGKKILVRFFHRLRDEKKFSNLKDLQLHISKDVQDSIRYFGKTTVRNALQNLNF